MGGNVRATYSSEYISWSKPAQVADDAELPGARWLRVHVAAAEADEDMAGDTDHDVREAWTGQDLS